MKLPRADGVRPSASAERSVLGDLGQPEGAPTSGDTERREPAPTSNDTRTGPPQLKKLCELPDGQRFVTANTNQHGYVGGQWPHGCLVFWDLEPLPDWYQPDALVYPRPARKRK